MLVTEIFGSKSYIKYEESLKKAFKGKQIWGELHPFTNLVYISE